MKTKNIDKNPGANGSWHYNNVEVKYGVVPKRQYSRIKRFYMLVFWSKSAKYMFFNSCRASGLNALTEYFRLAQLLIL